MRPADVTIVMAVRDAVDAVRLTLTSLLRSTRPLPAILVADNGSQDGALEWLTAEPRITTIPLTERLERTSLSVEQLRTHAAALDDLVGRTTTRWFLTLDSDVEILATDWLAGLVAYAERHGFHALGELEAGSPVSMPRLAPHALLVRTATFRQIGATFSGRAEIADSEDAARFLATSRPLTYRISLEEAASYPSARFYSTGALFFEEVERRGIPWGETPAHLRHAYHHLGHMSWASDHADLSARHDGLVTYARRRAAALLDDHRGGTS